MGWRFHFDLLIRARLARIANAIGDAYIVDQLEAKYEASRRASAWLQDRIKSLREDALAAEQAIVVFKQNNNIVESGGKLMNEQQMSEVNSQLILAHAATAEAKARLDRIQQVMSQDIPDSSLIDALKSQVIIKLREQYLELAGKEAAIRVVNSDLNPSNPTYVNADAHVLPFPECSFASMRGISY
jgi:succinoglycan biosynthesis transport protein ExoP